MTDRFYSQTNPSKLEQHKGAENRRDRELDEIDDEERPLPPSAHPVPLEQTDWGNQLTKLRQHDDQNPSLTAGSYARPLSRRVLRVFSEVRHLLKADPDQNRYMSCQIITGDDLEIRVRATIEGPPQSPYRRGIFHLGVVLPTNYPLPDPLVIKFLTPVYHPNIDHNGNLCSNLFSRANWSPIMTIRSALEVILSLLSDPMCEDAIALDVATTYIHDRDLFNLYAIAHTEKYATEAQSHPEWEVRPLSQLLDP
jgi:ubiquitin-protein ligase